MVAPGWYYAENDPPNTQRYWDGTTWVGQAVPVEQPPQTAAPQSPMPLNPMPQTAGGYELYAPPDTLAQQSYGAFDIVPATGRAQPMHSQAFQVQHPQQTAIPMDFDSGIRVLTTILSVLKAIPLVLVGLLLALVSDLRDDLEGTVNESTAEAIRDANNVVYLVFAIIALPLVVQVVAAFAKRPWILFLTSLLLTLVDITVVIGSSQGSAPTWFIAVIVLFAQAILTIWAFTIGWSRLSAKKARRAATIASAQVSPPAGY